MTDLTIPDAAVRATYGHPMTESLTNRSIRAVLETAGPVVVAAELRRVADTAPDPNTTVSEDEEELAYHEGLREMARRLRARADELEG